jgi:ATP-dependent DNA helicase RecQ
MKIDRGDLRDSLESPSSEISESAIDDARTGRTRRRIGRKGQTLGQHSVLPSSTLVKRARLTTLDAAELEITLRETFGFATLRGEQERVIARVMEGKDTLAVMPTGAGKSLCYQLPAMHLPGTTVVVSPLIALMKDQADKLGEAGIATVQLNSTLSASDVTDAISKVANGKVPIVFATPERMSDPAALEALSKAGVNLFVIDEAHCISQWGHDFRPAFLELSVALNALGQPPVLALTATATERVVEDILSELDRPHMAVIQTGIFRPNLHYRVVHTTNDDERMARVVQIVKGSQGSGIVYAATIKMVEALHEAMTDAGIAAGLYHGALAPSERRQQQDAFMSGELKVIAATNAFGLGVDKSDIRFVIHAQMPGNIEAYYQETGRGGRDGDPARCTLLYDARDRRVQQFFLAGRYPDADQVESVYENLKTQAADSAVGFDVLRATLPDMAAVKIKVAIKLLSDAGMVERGVAGKLAVTKSRIRPRSIAKLVAGYSDRSEHDREKLERMVFYAQTGLCRWRVLLEYFGEVLPHGERCNTCDNCIRAIRSERTPAVIDKPLRVTATKPKREYGAGDTVIVPCHGEGRILRTADDVITVEFPNGDERTFLRSYVKHVQPSLPAVSP